jgi:hypothetical protein
MQSSTCPPQTFSTSTAAGACRALFHFCNELIHLDDSLRNVAQLHHTTQVITKKKGGRSTWHYDGAHPKKKAVYDDEGQATSVTDYNHPSHKQEFTQREQFLRSILVTGAEENQVVSSLITESHSAVVDDDGHKREKMKWTFKREAGETMAMGMLANGGMQHATSDCASTESHHAC